jgi:hypothetical protein
MKTAIEKRFIAHNHDVITLAGVDAVNFFFICDVAK